MVRLPGCSGDVGRDDVGGVLAPRRSGSVVEPAYLTWAGWTTKSAAEEIRQRIGPVPADTSW